MNSFWKHSIKAVSFVGILALILFLISQIVVPGRGDGIQDPTVSEFLCEPENTIDVVIVGDSESYCAFVPSDLWKNQGITSFVCGTSAQKLYYSNELMKIALKTQKPKIIVLEANAIFRTFSYTDILSNKFDRLFAVLRFHDRWKTLTFGDVQSTTHYTHIENSKGYRFSTIIKKPEEVKYVKKTTDCAHVSEKNKLYVKEMAEYCKENGVKFVLISSPSLKNWNYSKHNAIEAIAEKNDIEYIDMNLLKEDVSIDWENDTYDKGDHLNYYGAEKVTSYFGKYLQKTALFSDHRGDESYSDWDFSCNKFEDAKNQLQIRSGNNKS